MRTFLGPFFIQLLEKREVFSYWPKNRCLVLVNCKGGFPRNSVVGLLTNSAEDPCLLGHKICHKFDKLSIKQESSIGQLTSYSLVSTSHTCR